MKYRIYQSETLVAPDKKMLGLEVQPPVTDEIARTIITYLLKDRSSYGTYTYTAETAVLTRNDESGTAFLVEPNPRNESPDAVAHAIGAMIDPCGVNEIEYVKPEQPAATPETA
jgi:hypothetical protein